VKKLSSLFDSVEFRIENREFVTHTGLYKGERVTAISTGIGTDNIDIVLNELDAIVNIDLSKRLRKENIAVWNLLESGLQGDYRLN
jgi:uridine phosphorylase